MLLHTLELIPAALIGAWAGGYAMYRASMARARRGCPGCARIQATRAELVDTLERVGDDTQPSAEYGPWRA